MTARKNLVTKLPTLQFIDALKATKVAVLMTTWEVDSLRKSDVTFIVKMFRVVNDMTMPKTFMTAF